MSHVAARSGVGGSQQYTGAENHHPALTPRQQEVLGAIQEMMIETGLSPSRSELARALGFKRTSSVEGHLTALARKGAIVLKPMVQRCIRIVDREERPVIDSGQGGPTGDRGRADEEIVDRMPGALSVRVRSTPEYFVQIHDDGLAALGVEDGDLAAVGQGIPIRTGSIVVGRDERGTWLYRHAVVSDDHQVRLASWESTETVGETVQTASGCEASLRFEGLLVGAVQVRAVGRAADAAGRRGDESDTAAPTRPGTQRRATNLEATRAQAQVLEVIRRHIQRQGTPPTLAEMARTLGDRKTGTIHGQIRSLARKGLIRQIPGVERGYWPAESVAVPIVDPDSQATGAQEGVDGYRIIGRAPSVLTDQLKPRPDYLIPGSAGIGDVLGLEPDDLMAVRGTCEANDGEIVIARIGKERRIVCGELQRHDQHHRKRGSVRGTAGAVAVGADMVEGTLRIEGVVSGIVTFRDLEQLRRQGDRSAGRSGA